jgi:fructose-6-phosphate aldolase 2
MHRRPDGDTVGCAAGLCAALREQGKNVYILPNPEMTAIFTPAQALMAAMAGASFVAPYVNRLDNILGDGCEVVAEIVNQLENYGSDCKVLAASFRNAEQVHKCSSVGCHSVTVSADILRKVISHPMTDAAVADFDKDWAKVYGDKTIADFE